jgi:hypothetical protein
VPLAAPGFATPGWLAQLRSVLAPRGDVLDAAVGHAYPLLACPHRRRPTIARLLSPAASRGLAAGLEPAVATAHDAGLPLRVSELGSAACGGEHGVSDAFASALWSTDTLFALVAKGVRSVNFHSWTGAFYAPLEATGSKAGARVVVHPSFYGMLLFSRATGAGARLLPVSAPALPGLRVWATSDDTGKVHIAVLNETGRTPRTLALRVAGAVSGEATVERLRAPGLGARFGVTLGGRGFGPRAGDGQLHGTEKTESVALHAGAYHVSVPPAQAALVTVAG